MNIKVIKDSTIFAVDDIKENLAILDQYLSDFDLKIVPFRSGEEMLNLIQKRIPDIILLDIMMPGGIDGYETCRRLKKNEVTKNIPVIFMSALADTIDKVKGFNLGAVDYITKPIEIEELLSRIHTHLSISHLQKELILVNTQLEDKVLIRTEELRKSNLQLQNEIIEHKKAEEQIKKDLEEKNILLQELYHRTNNNMQIISSMLKRQSQYSDNEFVHSTFKTINNRIKAMSLVQQKLYQSKELSIINLKEYIEDILTQLRRSYSNQAKSISLKLALKEVFVIIDSAVHLGLVLNELITNVYKHAFPDNKKGELLIRLYKEKDETINIVLDDNGVGFSFDFEPEKTETIGFQNVFSLVKYQLDGTINCERDKGVKWHIKFKDNQYQKRI
ncbi:MAG: response regulator [Candidatus Cloacimonetes bacterium]|nr:response regulator [Candidatus Cloacimonadota bacterium]